MSLIGLVSKCAMPICGCLVRLADDDEWLILICYMREQAQNLGKIFRISLRLGANQTSTNLWALASFSLTNIGSQPSTLYRSGFSVHVSVQWKVMV
jgi:hypothetical protein